jgi:hypothetical protein
LEREEKIRYNNKNTIAPAERRWEERRRRKGGKRKMEGEDIDEGHGIVTVNTRHFDELHMGISGKYIYTIHPTSQSLRDRREITPFDRPSGIILRRSAYSP